MGSVGNPVSSTAPNPNDIITSYYNSNNNNNNSKECLQVVLCSKRCPQWCIPPYNNNDDVDADNDSSSTTFSPLIIALFTILASAFLLIIYFFFISKYCKKRRDLSQIPHDHTPPDDNLDRLIVLRSGLDNGSIDSITVFKYKRGDGLIDSTDCAVCLTEFTEGESLRLLPNCSHAFHIHCIDAWLKSNSNCPLCRANGDPFLPPPQRQAYAL